MGSVFERKKHKNGLTSYMLKYSIRDNETGQRKVIYKTIQCRTKTEAKVELRRLESLVDLNEHALPSNITLNEFFERWVSEKVWKSQKTKERDTESVRIHILPVLGDKKMQTITGADIERVYSQMRSDGYRQRRWEAALIAAGKPIIPCSDQNPKGLSERTILKTHRTLFQVFKTAAKRKPKIVPQNVLIEVDPPRPEKSKAFSMLQDELDTLLQGLKGHPIFAIAAVGAATGLRLGEILGLRWRNIDFEKCTLRVDFAVEHTREFGTRIRDRVKNESSERTIGIDKNLVAILREVELQLRKDLLALGVTMSKDFLVFGKSVEFPDTPMRPGLVSRVFTKQAKALGFKGLHFHILRHTHASLLLANGVSIHVVSRRLGHANPVVTLNIYSHVMPRAEGEAVKVAETMLKNAVF